MFIGVDLILPLTDNLARLDCFGIIINTKSMSILNHLNAHMHLKKHIRLHVIADLNMRIFYFKKRPFIRMDLSNEKIYFN